MWTSAEENVIFSTKPIHNLEDLSKMRIRANESAGFAFSLTGRQRCFQCLPESCMTDSREAPSTPLPSPYNLAVSLHLL